MKKLLAAALFCAGFAHAQTTVDFANATLGEGFAATGDFVFASSRGVGLMPAGYLVANIAVPVSLYRASGQVFDLVSIQFGDRLNEGNDLVSLSATWYDVNDQANGLYIGNTDNQPGFQTFTLNLTGVTRVLFHGLDGSLPYWRDQESAAGFGPFTVNALNLDAQPLPVPEPSTLFILLLGLGTLYAGRRTWA